ncbi:MAG: helix-turn-helix domain-containing protein, partial [Ferroplasma sp.]
YIFANFQEASIERLKIDGVFTTHRIILKNKEDTETASQHLKLIANDVIKSGDKTLWAKASCCSACSIVGNSECVILNSRALNEKTIIYRLLIPNYHELQQLKERLEASCLNYTISDISLQNDNKLTPRETEIIIKMFENGYFNPHREITLSGISNEMHISTAALDEILRKSLRKIVKDYIEHKL